jgi:CheY-like chemotaxis protein
MSKTVLVADDNPRIRKMLCQMFEAENDYDICAEAANGQEAIALALKHHPDLIILDISMPVLNGIAAARELKRLMPDVPIILFTQFANPSNDVFGPNLPFDRIVSKEDGKDLMGHVKALVPV